MWIWEVPRTITSFIAGTATNNKLDRRIQAHSKQSKGGAPTGTQSVAIPPILSDLENANTVDAVVTSPDPDQQSQPEPHLQDEPEVSNIPNELESPESVQIPELEKEPELTQETELLQDAEPVQTPELEKEPEPLQEPELVQAPEIAEKPNLPGMPKNRRSAHKSPWAIGLLIVLLIGMLIPLILTVGYGLGAYSTYTTLRSRANSGMQHLLNLKTIFSSRARAVNPANFLDAGKLKQADQELIAAQADFAQVQSLLDHASVIALIMRYFPTYRPQITSARAASQIGMDVADMGHVLVGSVLKLAPKLHGPLLDASNSPLLHPDDIQLIHTTIKAMLPRFVDIQRQLGKLSLEALPISQNQRDQLRQVLPQLPVAAQLLGWTSDHMSDLGWVLGVGQPRTFLVQTMDRGELRPTGGFTGQYGELQINGGRVAPFSLHDISSIEYTDDSPTQGNEAPLAYRSWWPFANWGLRDSNLSADFPTSARIAIDLYQRETHHTVDGVIQFTPFLIEHILRAIGPLHIAKYQETITADNLEQRLHYYQLDNAGILKIQTLEHIKDPGQARKLFTSQVAHALMDRVRHASPQMLLAIAHQLMQDMQTRDVQIYMANAQLEHLLAQYHYDARMDRSTTHDGLYIVGANVSASKASQYVHTSIHDTISLDAHGGATHMMQMRLDYTQIGPVYGLDTYRYYVRVYVPPTAKFLGGTGFDTGIPLCGGRLVACAARSVYPHDELICPNGLYDAGASAPMIGDPFQGDWHPLDTIGPPDNLKSDEPGRAMFGGYIVVPKNCTMTVTLSWYIPPIPQHDYSLLVQRQASTYPQLDLTILPTPGNCDLLSIAGLHFNGIMTQDTLFTPHTVTSKCYPQSHV